MIKTVALSNRLYRYVQNLSSTILTHEACLLSLLFLLFFYDFFEIIFQNLKNTSRRSAGYIEASVTTAVTAIMIKPTAHFGFSRNLHLEATKLNISAYSLCNCISTIPIQKLPLQNGMLVPKWSPYREFFNYK